MLHLIPKERFEKACKGKRPDHRIELDLEDSGWPYYEIPELESWLIYIPELKTGLIFGEVPSDLGIVYDDWEITKISEKPNPKYILNTMKSCVYIKEDFYKICETGEWKITNLRFPFDLTFSIKISGSYFKQTAIGYEEKLKIPINKTEIRLIDKLIEYVGYGLRKDNKKSSVGS